MIKRPPMVPGFDVFVLDTLEHWFEKFVEQIGKDDSHRHLQGWLVKQFRDGHLTLRRLIFELTRDPETALDADLAVREIADEMFKYGALPDIVTGYLIGPAPTRGAKRYRGDTWLRDVCVASVTGFAVERWGEHFPMVASAKRPGICTLVSTVCMRNKLPLGERQVFDIYKRVSRFMPVHQELLQIAKNRPA
jgi:hypothetical protein